MLFVLTSCLLLGQSFGPSVDFYGAIPQDVPVYRVILSEGQNTREEYAAIKYNHEWIDASRENLPPASRIELIFDAPWDAARSSESIRYSPDRVQFEHQSGRLREVRLEREWQDAGFTIMETNGTKIPVREGEIALAERAAQMEAEMLAQREAPEKLAGITAGGDTNASHTPINPLMVWWPHALVALLTLLVAGAIVKWLILEEAGWQKVG